MVYLVEHGHVSEELAAYYRYPMMRTWDALKEHINGERALRGDPANSFLDSWERFVDGRRT